MTNDKRPIEELRDPRTGELISTTARYRAGRSAKILDSYYDYDGSAALGCPSCGWEGSGGQAEMEVHRVLTDFSCPRCDQMLLIVPHPTRGQTEAAAAAGNAEAIRTLRRWDETEGP